VTTIAISTLGNYAFDGCPSLTAAGINFYAIQNCNQIVTPTGSYWLRTDPDSHQVDTNLHSAGCLATGAINIPNN
jgi:hypothetical protein